MSREDDGVVGALVSLCKERGITCLVDVGCEDAYEAEAIRATTGCRAVGIDADPKVEPEWPRVEFHRALIGATDCVGMTFYTHILSGMSSPYFRGDGKEQAKHYPQWRLDTFCREYDISPDALLIDTEGAGIDVLEGCGNLLSDVKLAYVEVQHAPLRPGMRPAEMVDDYMLTRGFTKHEGLPSYCAGSQSNYTYVRK